MLLVHRSGITDNDLGALMSAQLSSPDIPITTRDALLQGLSKGSLFAPGKGWSYSNAAYLLLSLIIDRNSGMTYEEYIRRKIIVPLDLKDTIMPTDPPLKTIPGDHMWCVYRSGTGASWNDNIDMYYLWNRGAGDIISTVANLNTFHRALREGHILKPEMFRKMCRFEKIPLSSPNPLIKDLDSRYGLGYASVQSKSLNTTLEGHVGGYSGSMTAMLYWKEGDTYLAFNTNGSYSPGYETAFIFPIIHYLKQVKKK